MKERCRGSILISTLWILSLLSVLAISMNYRMALELQLAQMDWEDVRAAALAQAGIVAAAARLENDIDSVDGLYRCGVTVPVGVDEKISWEQELESGRFRVGYDWGRYRIEGIGDEDGKINLNSSDEGTLEKFFRVIGGVESPAQLMPLVHALMDWRDADSTRSYLDGAESAYYESLDHPYPCANRPLQTLEELQLVRGMTDKIYQKIKPYATVFGSPNSFRVNLNTAPREVLDVLAQRAGFSASEAGEWARQIDGYRFGSDRIPATPDDGLFSDADVAQMEKLVRSPNFTDEKRVGAFKMFFQGHSTYYRIESEGIPGSGKVKKKRVAIVQKDKDHLKFVHFSED